MFSPHLDLFIILIILIIQLQLLFNREVTGSNFQLFLNQIQTDFIVLQMVKLSFSKSRFVESVTEITILHKRVYCQFRTIYINPCNPRIKFLKLFQIDFFIIFYQFIQRDIYNIFYKFFSGITPDYCIDNLYFFEVIYFDYLS